MGLVSLSLLLFLLLLPTQVSAKGELVAWWRFEDEAAIGKDETGKHPARVVGKVKLGDGKVGKAIWLDGEGFLEVEPSPELDLTDEVTIEAWVCPKAVLQGGMRIVDKTTVGTNEAYMIDTYPMLSLRFVGEPSHVVAKDVLKLGEWQHVAATFDGRRGIIRLFVNGNIVAEQFVLRGKLTVNKNSLRIGADNLGGNRWIGGIDEVRIYARALRPGEILMRYFGKEVKPDKSAKTKRARKVSVSFKDGKVHVDFQKLASRNDIAYLSPALFEFEAMPIGNGRLGTVVWNEDLLSLQLSHTDYYGIEFPALCRIRLMSEPLLWGEVGKAKVEFEQRLSLADGEIRMRSKSKDGSVTAEIFVAEGIDLLLIRLNDTRKAKRKVALEFWRKGNEVEWLVGKDFVGVCESFKHPSNERFSRSMCVLLTSLDADVKVETVKDGIATLSLPEKAPIQLTIAAAVSVVVGDIETAKKKAMEALGEAKRRGYEKLRDEHRRFWRSFWERSFIYLTDEDGIADYLENLWWLHMYWMGASSRGEFPPKFNGGIFTFCRDERSWGGAYWHQNQRELYWSLFAANRIELVEPFFRLYEGMLEAAKQNAKKFFGCNGAYFPETVFADGDPRKWRNQYTSHILTVGLEVALQMWWRYRYTGDEKFLKERFYPFTKECVAFYLDYLKESEDGYLHIEPVHAQESFWLVRDAHTDLVALRWVLPLLIQLSERYGIDAEERERWKETLKRLAPLPLKEDGTFAPADISPNPQRRNCENVELYGIFPFGIFGAGRLEPERALRTFLNRPIKGICCGWNPAPIHAARLWLADEALTLLLQHARENQLMPQGFWFSPGGRKYGDLIPEIGYFDSSGVAAMALSEMLLQSDSGTIIVAPAIPKDWVAKFSLRAVGGFVVTAEVAYGDVLYVLLKSENGEVCEIANPWGDREVEVRILPSEGSPKSVTRIKGRLLRFKTERSKSYLITPLGRPISSFSFERLAPKPNGAPKYPGYKSFPPPWERKGYPSTAHFPCLGISSNGKSPARDFVLMASSSVKSGQQ